MVPGRSDWCLRRRKRFRGRSFHTPTCSRSHPRASRSRRPRKRTTLRERTRTDWGLPRPRTPRCPRMIRTRSGPSRCPRPHRRMRQAARTSSACMCRSRTCSAPPRHRFAPPHTRRNPRCPHSRRGPPRNSRRAARRSWVRRAPSRSLRPCPSRSRRHPMPRPRIPAREPPGIRAHPPSTPRGALFVRLSKGRSWFKGAQGDDHSPSARVGQGASPGGGSDRSPPSARSGADSKGKSS